jgi:Skp family chaperone for outer membrane proteins
MKDWLRLGGLLLLVGALFLAGRSWSGSPVAGPPGKSKSRVAVINVAEVMRNYDRFKAFQKVVQGLAGPFQARDKAYRKESQKLAEEAKDKTITVERREKIEERLKQLQRAIEDNQAAGKKALSRKQDEQLKILFNDVRTAATRYAKDHDIELVLQYSDAVNPVEFESPQNIARKMQLGACVPLYAAPGIDISKEITAALNDAFTRRKSSF